MKKLLALSLVILLISCETPKQNNSQVHGNFGDFKVIEIDHCEYILFEEGMLEQRVYSITHKGNCKNHTK